jgi:hypothetical protein
MMAKKSPAGEWMRANGYKWRTDAKHAPDPNQEKTSTGQRVRGKRMATMFSKSLNRRWRQEYDRQSVKDFVEHQRDWNRTECRLVPGAQPHVPAQVQHCGRHITAARYMLLLTQGTPKSEGMWARHKCGNGHLSCVNPSHLEWGTPGDNIGDANIHRAMEGATVEDKCRAVDARTSK